MAKNGCSDVFMAIGPPPSVKTALPGPSMQSLGRSTAATARDARQEPGPSTGRRSAARVRSETIARTMLIIASRVSTTRGAATRKGCPLPRRPRATFRPTRTRTSRSRHALRSKPASVRVARQRSKRPEPPSVRRLTVTSLDTLTPPSVPAAAAKSLALQGTSATAAALAESLTLA